MHGLQVLILMTERCRPGVSHAGQAMEYDGKLVAIQIWDTGTNGSKLQPLPFSRRRLTLVVTRPPARRRISAGQERFNAVARSYYRGAVYVNGHGYLCRCTNRPLTLWFVSTP